MLRWRAIQLPNVRQRLRWLWAMPSVVMSLFVLALVAFVVLFNQQAREQQHNSLIEDILWQEQTLRLHFIGVQNTLQDVAHELVQAQSSDRKFHQLAANFMRNNPEVIAMRQLDASGRVRWQTPGELADKYFDLDVADEAAHWRAQQLQAPNYSMPYHRTRYDAWLSLHVPLPVDASNAAPLATPVPSGTLAVTISLAALLRHYVPWWLAQQYEVAVLDLDGQVLASRLNLSTTIPQAQYQIAFDPPGYGLSLRASRYKNDNSRLQQALAIVIVGLASLMVWSLWSLRRHMRERLEAEEALRGETALRRAMEDSVVSGLRAIDMQGRIIYVNRAFCQLTGFHEHELLGAIAPMPYWAEEDRHNAYAAFHATLAGQQPANGYVLRFKRKNGERFDVRFYASPLIDDSGHQLGWMASLYDITELKREREALKASHERFVAMLDCLPAAVSVVDAASAQLLFVNPHFRQLYDSSLADASSCYALPLWRLCEQAAQGSESGHEIYDPYSGCWLDVRNQALTWTNGQRVILTIAADISAKKHADSLQRQHLEKLQRTARLVTMGEMASTLAHELNQPLSAIASYSTGCLNRVEQGMPAQQLQPALEKIAQQARRAGQIIGAIRDFVRKRESRREWTDLNRMVDNAVALVTAEATKRGAVLLREFSAELPLVWVDSVMIEQVVVNLLKNALEAMQDTLQPQRVVTVRTAACADDVRIVVEDVGTGLPSGDFEQLFAPFYSTKEDGMGMGLNICRSVIEFHQGRLTGANRPQGGAIFIVTLPREQDEQTNGLDRR